MQNSQKLLTSSSSSARSPRERKNCLKRVLKQTLILQDSISGTTINKLNKAISEVDDVSFETSVHDKVCNQQEVFIDSQMMITSSKVIKTCATSLTKSIRDYDHVDFAQKIVKYLQEDDEQSLNWSLLETEITKLFKSIPNYSTLLGTLEPLEKKVVNRKKPERRVAQQATLIVPEKVVANTNAKEDDSVERTMQKIRKLIVCHYKEMQTLLDLFKLIIHPHDFGRTIRNLLYVSFLIKEGVVKLTKDNERLIVQPCRKTASQSNEQSNNRTGAQTIISLNVKQWTILTKAYNITEPMIDFDEGN